MTDLLSTIKANPRSQATTLFIMVWKRLRRARCCISCHHFPKSRAFRTIGVGTYASTAAFAQIMIQYILNALNAIDLGLICCRREGGWVTV